MRSFSSTSKGSEGGKSWTGRSWGWEGNHNQSERSEDQLTKENIMKTIVFSKIERINWFKSFAKTINDGEILINSSHLTKSEYCVTTIKKRCSQS